MRKYSVKQYIIYYLSIKNNIKNTITATLLTSNKILVFPIWYGVNPTQ